VAVTRTSEPWTALLDEGREDGRLVREAFEGAREPLLEPIPETLHPAVIAALEARGIDALYAHQAEAVAAAWAGPTIVTTGTASGKSLAFQLPTLDVLCRDARARALYLYPTKALAQDQARSINAFGIGDDFPDRTLVLALAEGGARARARDNEESDRIGGRPEGYHQKVDLAFRLIAAEEPGRVRLIDASGLPDEVTQRLLDALEDLLP